MVIRPTERRDLAGGRAAAVELRRLIEDRIGLGGIAAADRDRLIRIRDDLDALRDTTIADLLAELRDRIPVPDPPPSRDPRIDPVKLSEMLLSLDQPPARPGSTPLHDLTGSLLEILRKQDPMALPSEPLKPGGKGAVMGLGSAALTRLVRIAAAGLSQGAGEVVWDDGVNQILVQPGAIEVTLTDGRLRVAIPVETDAGRTVMTVPFALGGKERVAGLVTATLDRPAGDATIAAIWGEALIALAWGAVMDAVESLAGASGRDTGNDRLVPRAVAASHGRLTIETQAAFALKRPLRGGTP